MASNKYQALQNFISSLPTTLLYREAVKRFGTTISEDERVHLFMGKLPAATQAVCDESDEQGRHHTDASLTRRAKESREAQLVHLHVHPRNQPQQRARYERLLDLRQRDNRHTVENDDPDWKTRHDNTTVYRY